MKNLLFVLAFFMCVIAVNGQSYDGKGDKKFNIGYEAYGLGNGIKATYDYGLGELFSIGAGGTVYFDNEENDYFIYARTQLHLGIAFDLPCKFDIYPGVELGYVSSEKVGIAGYVGFRYFITDKMGLFAEIGNNGALGLSFNV